MADQTRTIPTRRRSVQVGERFGRLVVLVPDQRLHRKRAALVRCACGSDKRIRHEHLLSGDIQSCGCLRAEFLEMWRDLRQDDDGAASSPSEERRPEVDLRRTTLDRLNFQPPLA